MKNHTVVYRCYSEKESEFLKAHDMEYIIKCRDIKTNAVMRLYDRTDQLNKLLDEYKALAN